MRWLPGSGGPDPGARMELLALVVNSVPTRGAQHMASFAGSKISAVKALGLRPGCCIARLNIRRYSWSAASFGVEATSPAGVPMEAGLRLVQVLFALLRPGPGMPRQSASIAASACALLYKLKISQSLSFKALRAGFGSTTAGRGGLLAEPPLLAPPAAAALPPTVRGASPDGPPTPTDSGLSAGSPPSPSMRCLERKRVAKAKVCTIFVA
mmetsp:Transcript_111609/g.279480  ORF Transcript_111609/g.279480 Transcript_111609/m.279480 type:complete len:211 (-) Transcript_111609:882-1514(-)